MQLKKISNLIISLFICLYIFLAFLPLPSGIRVGLDPSWQYAISRGVVDKIVFGKDIIFTYGPLGYLIHGSVLTENFYLILSFRIIVESIVFCISIATITFQKTNYHKVLLSISIFFAYLFGLSIDYKIIFAVIMLLSWDNMVNKKNIRLWGLGLGSIAGLGLLTKFNIGVCTLGIVILIILAEILQSHHKRIDLSTSLFALMDALIATLTASFLLLHPNLVNNFNQFLLCLLTATFLGIFSHFIKLKILNKAHNLELLNSSKIYKKIYANINFKNCFYIAYIFAILLTTLYSSPLLTNYLKGSLEISSGYSSAMSIVGSHWELGFAIIGLFMVFLILLQLMTKGFVGLGLVLFFTLWMSFKHGYVRQDGHIYIFIQSLLIISSIAIIKLNNSFKIIRNLTLCYLGLIISIYCFATSPFGNANLNVGSNLITIFKPINVIDKVLFLINPEKLLDSINKNSSSELSKVSFPEPLLQLLNNQTVDIVPWEISLVESNKLKWQPRPIFQSFSAYTKFLDNANLNSISTKSPNYIIYHFNSIDGRHPFFDEPSTFSYIACNYKLSSEFNKLIKLNTPDISDLLLLQKRDTNVCSSSIETQNSSISWNESTKVNDSSYLVRASIKFQYSLLGKIYKTVFRAPPVNIEIFFKNLTSHSFRIIPENSENGVMISHLPLNASQALSFFDGQWNQRVQSFKFSTVNPFLYKENIDVKLDAYQIIDSSIRIKDESIDITKLKEITFS
ncbi:hypothetical protein NWP21_09620 [Anabaenopsis sp. FSS-46]|uniref:hypothetical protein n=1 Tax=Anabaenopsis sp. FSS-46 TaxID=2971766 RepID=UPI0024759C36|nr:hypothetical protein [Anabaenopsis sp. FSS-46]MDH6099096.1 hypothetical protein [Anabaenopsis sp. FSS-46]